MLSKNLQRFLSSVGWDMAKVLVNTIFHVATVWNVYVYLTPKPQPVADFMKVEIVVENGRKLLSEKQKISKAGARPRNQ